jgi:hypothetical protein
MAPTSPLSNTLTHATIVTNSLHRHTSHFAKPYHVHWSTTFSNFRSICNPAGKRAQHQSDPPTGPHQARRLTTKHTPTHTHHVSSSLHQTRQIVDEEQLSIRATPCSKSGRSLLSDAKRAPNRSETPDLFYLNILSLASPATAQLPPRPLTHPRHLTVTGETSATPLHCDVVLRLHNMVDETLLSPTLETTISENVIF